jgi:signal transduction histidine kinase
MAPPTDLPPFGAAAGQTTGVRRYRSSSLSARLALASLGTAVAVGVVCAVGLSSLAHTSRVAREAVTQQLALIDDAAAMSAFQYQKGFVAEYLLTGNRAWLSELETSRPAFESWLASAHAKVTTPALGHLLDSIQEEYTAYDGARKAAVGLYDAGRVDEAKSVLDGNHARTQQLWNLFREFGRMARQDAERTLSDAEQSVGRLGRVLVGTSIAGALASLLVGFLWARRITKPIYELEVQIESAAERTRIQVAPGRAGLEALGDQVGALVEKLEETDTALVEHRRRLVQSEKLSAVGELAAKLAHEVLNPLAGMKAAVQLLARQGAATPAGTEVVQTAEALNREIARVEGLVRRLVNYSRPLAPRMEVVTIGSLFNAALEAVQPAFVRRGVVLQRDEEPGLPPVEVDSLLFTQVLVNLLTNAAEATGPAGSVNLSAARATSRRDEVTIRVTDRGPGLSSIQMLELFKPFFTTKPEGHGLGLAVSQNIVLEHGGRIAARNRPSEEGSGALFEIQLPVIR